MKLTICCRGTILLVFLTACSGMFATPYPTATPDAETETPTSSIAWFPPTNTPTPYFTPTVMPTPEQLPGMGALLFTDNFSQPSLWNTSTTTWASASVTRNRLILSISGHGPITITSMRSEPMLGDFYAEATVTLNLCEGDDQFGVIFRAAPGDNYYRFTVTCNGQTRLERSLTANRVPINDWLTSGDAPVAAPAVVKLGVWATGNEMRFFLNDHFQFTVLDPILHEGTFGFFAYTSGSSPIIASFSNLSAYSISYVSPTPIWTPAP